MRMAISSPSSARTGGRATSKANSSKPTADATRIENTPGRDSVLSPACVNGNGRGKRAKPFRRTLLLPDIARAGLQIFIDSGRLAQAIAQIIKLVAAHITAAHYLDIGHHRAVGLEHTLDTFAVRNFADGEG